MGKRVKVDVSWRGDKPAYAFSPIDKELAEREKIPHGCVYLLALKPTGSLLRIRRVADDDTYPDCWSVPAGHMDVLKNGRYESRKRAALRELEEETNLKPLKPYAIAPVLEHEYILDKDKGHVGFAFVAAIGLGDRPKFNKEINKTDSGWAPPEMLRDSLETQQWTPPCHRMVDGFLRKYNYNLSGELSNLYLSLLAGLPPRPSAP